jgi:hypothetical protein
MNEYFFPNRMTPNTEITENCVEGNLLRPFVHLIKSAPVIQIIATFLLKFNKNASVYYRLITLTASHVAFKMSLIAIRNFSFGKF